MSKEQTSQSRITNDGKILEKFHYSKKFKIGFQAESWEYQELTNGRELMRDYGSLLGVEISYQGLLSDITSFELNGSVISGSTTYDGEYLISGEEVQQDSENRIIEYGGLISRVFHDDYTKVYELGTGLMIRVLENPDLDDVEGDYYRKITYLYIPIGLQAKFLVNDDFHLSFGVFYKYLLQGEVETELANTTLYLEQTEGEGVDVFADLKYTGTSYSLSVRPYYKTWIVEDSNSEVLGGLSLYEPKNKSTSIGAILSLNF